MSEDFTSRCGGIVMNLGIGRVNSEPPFMLGYYNVRPNKERWVALTPRPNPGLNFGMAVVCVGLGIVGAGA